MSSLLVTCPYCKGKAELIASREIYGRDFGFLWICRPCDAWVGCHKNSPDHAPLGRLADKALRSWRRRAHAAFDPVWQGGGMTRRAAYRHLAEIMQIPEKRAHIGLFSVEGCKLLVSLLSQVNREVA